MPTRSYAKIAAELLLIRSGVERMALRRHRGDTVVLAYHNIVPTGERIAGDGSLHLPQQVFARQLDILTTTHNVLPLAAALRGANGDSTRPSAVITFDDAYAGAVRVGVAELSQRGLPATIFVPPALLDGHVFWWDVLTPRDTSALPARVRDTALTQFGGDGERVLAHADPSGALSTAVPEHARGASLKDLVVAAATPGITLASHTWSHPNLADLDPSRLTEELSRPLEWLRARFDNVLPYLTYPYGLSSARAEQAVRAAGYEAALRISGGWLNSRSSSPFSLPRVNIPAGLTAAGFRLRAAGMLQR